MADISKINVGGTSYNIKDSVAREALTGLTGAMHYIGTTTTPITDGADTTPVAITGKDNVTPNAGDVVIYGNKEFVWNGSAWNEFGDMGSLKALAFKDSAEGTFTPQGSNSPSAVTLTGGATSKLDTDTINTTTVHDTPSVTTDNIGSASEWSEGTMFTAEVSGEELTLTAGTAPSLTVTSKAVATGITAGTAVNVLAGDAAITYAKGTVSSTGAGATVATELPTSGTAAAQEFAGQEGTVTVQ